MNCGLSWTQRITSGVEAALDVATEPVVQAAVVIAAGMVAGYLLGRLTTRLLDLLGVSTLVEGTGSERWLQRMGTSTVIFVGRLVSLFIYAAAFLSAFLIMGALDADTFWELATAWLPDLFVAIFVLMVGVVLADKVELLIADRLQGMKLPEISVIPLVVKWSIIFIALLIALGQVGVDTAALLVVLIVYVFGLVLLTVVALQDFLSSGAAGVYLLLREPYAIGDEITLDGNTGVVQEVGVFVTRIEDDDREHVIPNRRVMQAGVQRTPSFDD